MIEPSNCILKVNGFPIIHRYLCSKIESKTKVRKSGCWGQSNGPLSLLRKAFVLSRVFGTECGRSVSACRRLFDLRQEPLQLHRESLFITCRGVVGCHFTNAHVVMPDIGNVLHSLHVSVVQFTCEQVQCDVAIDGDAT
jgi:hypothetical protein